MPVAAGARVVVFSAPPLLEPVADSNGGTSRDIENDPIVQRAAARRGFVGGTVTRGGASYAEAAASVARGGPVVLLSSSLHNDLESVEVVRTRMLVAGGHRGGVRDRVRLRACDALRATHPPPRGGRRADRGRTLRRDGGRSRPRRAGSARAGLRAYAAAACEPRPRARRVHRERVARAADAAVLARPDSSSCSTTRRSTRRPGPSSSRRCATS